MVMVTVHGKRGDGHDDNDDDGHNDDGKNDNDIKHRQDGNDANENEEVERGVIDPFDENVKVLDSFDPW